MFPTLSHTVRTLAIAGSLAGSLFAQTHAPTPPPAAPEPVFVLHKDFRSKLFVVKHRDPSDLKHSLLALGSGTKGAEVTSNRNMGTLSVRDFPENIAAIEEALKRLDTPEPTRRDVEFHIHVLFASNSPVHGSDYPEELRDVLGALKSTLTYRTYTLAATLVQRAQEGSRGIFAKGATEVRFTEGKGGEQAMPLPFAFQIDAFKVETPTAGPSVLKLDGFSFEFYSNTPGWQARMRTDLSLRDGEKVVVGTSTLKDRGVVIVVTARLLK